MSYVTLRDLPFFSVPRFPHFEIEMLCHRLWRILNSREECQLMCKILACSKPLYRYQAPGYVDPITPGLSWKDIWGTQSQSGASFLAGSWDSWLFWLTWPLFCSGPWPCPDVDFHPLIQVTLGLLCLIPPVVEMLRLILRTCQAPGPGVPGTAGLYHLSECENRTSVGSLSCLYQYLRSWGYGEQC